MRDRARHTEQNKDDHALHGALDHSIHDMQHHSTHNAPQSHTWGQDDHSVHAGHGADHTGHEPMFRVRFWWSLLLSIPVLLYSEMIQMWFGFTPRAFPGSAWIPFIFSLIVF